MGGGKYSRGIRRLLPNSRRGLVAILLLSDRINSQPSGKRLPSGPVAGPRLRARLCDGRDRGGGDHIEAMGESGRGPTPRAGGRPVGVSRRPDRWPAVFPRHQLGPGAAPLVGALRRLARWARNLGRNRLRHAGGPIGSSPPRRRYPAIPRCSRPSPARCPVHRSPRQLLQPGVVWRPRPRSPGDSRSIPPTDRPDTRASRPFTRRSYTRSSGTWRWPVYSFGSESAERSGRRGYSPSTSPGYWGFGSSRNSCAWTQPTISSGCAWLYVAASPPWSGWRGLLAVSEGQTAPNVSTAGRRSPAAR